MGLLHLMIERDFDFIQGNEVLGSSSKVKRKSQLKSPDMLCSLPLSQLCREYHGLAWRTFSHLDHRSPTHLRIARIYTRHDINPLFNTSVATL